MKNKKVIFGVIISFLVVLTIIVGVILADPMNRQIAYALLTDGYINCMPGVNDGGQIHAMNNGITEGEWDHREKEKDLCEVAKSMGIKVAY